MMTFLRNHIDHTRKIYNLNINFEVYLIGAFFFYIYPYEEKS